MQNIGELGEGTWDLPVQFFHNFLWIFNYFKKKCKKKKNLNMNEQSKCKI